MNIKNNEKWIKHWAGHFNFVYDTLLGLHNTVLLKKYLGVDLGRAMYIYRKEYTFAYFKESDYKNFGKKIALKLIKKPTLGVKWAKAFMKITDANMIFMKKYKNKDLTTKSYGQFTKFFNDYSTLHRPIKVVVDYLPGKILKKLMPLFTKARIHAEPVYEHHDKMMQSFAKRLSKKSGYKYNHLLALANDEVKKYLEKRVLPAEKILAERYKGCVIIFQKGKHTISVGDKVKKMETALAGAYDEKILKGTVAFPGKAKGTVRIIFDPFKPNNFKKGDILVTGMTRPEFLPLMHKAAAFVTDAGGMLSHAAITAREMKKPCVVGTEVATKVLKDGDRVEVEIGRASCR